MPMQPSPSAETSRPWLPKVLLFINSLLIDRNLSLDEGEVRLHLLELGPHRRPVLLEQRQPLVLVALAGSHQLRVAADPADWHPSGPQATQWLDPSEGGLAVAEMARSGAVDAVDQPGAFVVAQGVDADSGRRGGVGDGQAALF